MKIWDIIKEDFEGQQNLEEDWKNNIMATVMAVSSMLGSTKAGTRNPVGGGDPNVSTVKSNDANSTTVKMDISKLFSSGQYAFHAEDDAIIKNELVRLGKELEQNRMADLVIQVVSSESRVPNVDNERNSPTYGQRLKPMELAKKRSVTATYIIQSFLLQLQDKGLLKGKIYVQQPKILLGDAAWPMAGKTKDDSIYTKDQYTYVNIKIKKSQGTYDPFSIFADRGEIIHMGSKAVGVIFYPSRSSSDEKDAGMLNTSNQTVLFKTTKPESELGGGLHGLKDEKNVYVNTYIIPSDWWNKNISNQSITPEQLNYIDQNFKAN